VTPNENSARFLTRSIEATGNDCPRLPVHQGEHGKAAGLCFPHFPGGQKSMIPIGDYSRRPRHLPIVTALLILTNVLVFVLELTGGDAFINEWSVVPADIVAGQRWFSIFTAMFMHASWSHILGNMVFLWAFGPQIEDAMNPIRYLIFYLAGGLIAMFAQIAGDPSSSLPNLGASGAIAAVMGAFLVTYPRDQIQTIIIFGFYWRVTLIPAALLIGLWLLIQFLSIGAVTDVANEGVAYLAHVGGAIFGVLTARLWEDPRRLRGERIGSDLIQ
jgi:membrane associated rhomboid family serine protease